MILLIKRNALQEFGGFWEILSVLLTVAKAEQQLLKNMAIISPFCWNLNILKYKLQVLRFIEQYDKVYYNHFFKVYLGHSSISLKWDVQTRNYFSRFLGEQQE